jgi:hypothetical protein
MTENVIKYKQATQRLYREWGRKPTIDALLRHHGMVN